MNAAYLIQQTLAHIKRFEPSLDVSWHEESILSTRKIKRPAIMFCGAFKDGKRVQGHALEILNFRTVVTLPEEDSKTVAKIWEKSYTERELKEIDQQLEAMWQRGEELNVHQYMEERGLIPPSSQKGSYPPTPTGEPSIERVTWFQFRQSKDSNASYRHLPWFRE